MSGDNAATNDAPKLRGGQDAVYMWHPVKLATENGPDEWGGWACHIDPSTTPQSYDGCVTMTSLGNFMKGDRLPHTFYLFAFCEPQSPFSSCAFFFG